MLGVKYKDRTIQKIKKCLALGKSCEPHEASLAIKRAQELMEKYGVTVDDVKLSDINRVDAFMGKAKTPPRFEFSLAAMIRDVFGCETVLKPGYGFRTGYYTDVSFIGFGPSAELAAYTFDVLNKQIVKGRKTYLATLQKRLKRSTKTRRGDLWAEAWVRAAAKKAITLSLSKNKKELIEKWKALEYSNLQDTTPKKIKYKGRGDYDAVVKGIEAGSDATLHHGVNNTGQTPLKLGQ